MNALPVPIAAKEEATTLTIAIPETWRRKHLSPAEQRVVEKIGEGLALKTIADQLGKSQSTVKHQLANAIRKVGAKNRYQLFVILQTHSRRNERASPNHALAPTCDCAV